MPVHPRTKARRERSLKKKILSFESLENLDEDSKAQVDIEDEGQFEDARDWDREDFDARRCLIFQERIKIFSEPIWDASVAGDLAAVVFLIAHGEPVDSRHPHSGFTPLWVSCENGYDPLVRLFLKMGAELNLIADDGSTPLFAASQNGHAHVHMLPNMYLQFLF